MENNFERSIIDEIKKLGAVHEKVRDLLCHDIFDHISKHDPIWDDENSRAVDRLWEMRSHVRYVQDKLSEIYDMLDGND